MPQPPFERGSCCRAPPEEPLTAVGEAGLRTRLDFPSDAHPLAFQAQGTVSPELQGMATRAVGSREAPKGEGLESRRLAAESFVDWANSPHSAPEKETPAVDPEVVAPGPVVGL